MLPNRSSLVPGFGAATFLRHRQQPGWAIAAYYVSKDDETRDSSYYDATLESDHEDFGYGSSDESSTSGHPAPTFSFKAAEKHTSGDLQYWVFKEFELLLEDVSDLHMDFWEDLKDLRGK